MNQKNRNLIVSFPFDESTIPIDDIDGSLTLDELMRNHGLGARDGSFQFLTDSNGRMVNHLSLDTVPHVVHVQFPKNVDQLWVDEPQRNGFASAMDSAGQKIALLGGEENMFTSVYITGWKLRNETPVAFCFSPTFPHYHIGSLVYLQVPLAGNEACIYNPATGKEDLKLLLEMSDLELNRMRGFWSAWELIGNGLRAKYRVDITPKPAGFKPLKPRSKKKKLRLNVDQLSATSQNSSVHTGRLHFGNSRSPALVCGVSSQGANTQKGMVVARSNKTRPNLVNLEGYQYGMTQFVKVPEEGRIIQLYNSVAKQWVDCTLLMSDEYDIEKIRNQWVIVKLKKHTRYKRALKIIALPREFYKKKTN